jgi:hypothetical protein
MALSNETLAILASDFLATVRSLSDALRQEAPGASLVAAATPTGAPSRGLAPCGFL